MGLFWLAAAVGFWVSGAAAVGDLAWWIPMAASVTVASLLLTLVELPEARVGLAVNLVILAGLFVVWRAGAP